MDLPGRSASTAWAFLQQLRETHNIQDYLQTATSTDAKACSDL
jgi:hypothetical protein